MNIPVYEVIEHKDKTYTTDWPINLYTLNDLQVHKITGLELITIAELRQQYGI